MTTARLLFIPCWCAALIFAASSAVAHPQVGGSIQMGPQSPRDQPPPRVGNASIKGRVMDGATGTPLARARVRLQGGGGARPGTLTDAQGRFSFSQLPAGPMSLVVEKPTYMGGTFPEAGKTVRASMRPLILKDGEATEVTIPLYHGGVLAGRVVDSQGDLVENADVRVMLMPRTRSGRPTMRGGGSTNDIGEFRIPRLEPGSYVLLVSPRQRPPEDPAETQPIPTYYPGVASLEEAQPIAVERGQSVAGIELVMAEGSPSIVTGFVVDASGQPLSSGAYINARALMKDTPGMWSMTGTGGSVKPDGTFQLKLTPGEYDLETNAMRSGMNGPPQPGDEQFGTVRITVGAGPVSDVIIRVGRAGTVSGRIVFEGTSPLPPTPQQVRIGFNGAEGAMCRSGRSETMADWTFKIDGVFGACTVNAMGGVGRWTLKTVTRGNETLLDRPIMVQPGQDLKSVVVVFTDKRTQLNLSVTDANGQLTSEYVALVYSTDKDRWSSNSRYIQSYSPPSTELMAMMMAQRRPPSGATPSMGTAMPRRDSFGGLPPGEYYVVAVDDIERDQVRDPAVLEQLSSRATRVTLAEGAPAEVQLRVRKF